MIKIIQKGSSETIRETTFQFETFLNSLPQHKKKIDRKFLEWFIGFTEGDGSFIVTKSGDKKRLMFMITQKEIQVLHKLRTTLGFGKVQNHGKYHRYYVGDNKGIDRLIHLFNGNLLLKKTNKRFEDWVNTRNLVQSSSENIQLKDSIKTHMFLKTGWLSGFTDSVGCFNLDRQSSTRIVCRFILDQKDELFVLETLKDQIGAGSIYNLSNSGNFRYTLVQIDYLIILMKYFKEHPLRSQKNISCIRFEKMMFYITNRELVLWEGKVLKRIERLIKSNKKPED
jgi:hypothetical protein